MSERIGIYQDVDGKVGFFSEDLPSTVTKVLDGAMNVLSEGVSLVDEPPPDTKAKHVGDVVIEPVTDPDVYVVQANEEPVCKPDVDRTPDAEPGGWVTQSVVFSKDKFTLEEAKAWISEHDEVGNYGMDETDSSYRFRQYNTEHFSEFKTLVITEGVAFVRGKVKQTAEDENEEEKAAAVKAYELACSAIEAVWAVNKGILAKGIKLLGKSAEVRKDEDDSEERFILGLVLEPNDGQDGAPMKPDTQDDVYSEDDIRKTAHGWMEHYGQVDLMHSWKALSKDEARILETYLAPVTFTIGEGDDAYEVVKGTWLLGMRIVNDELWEAVKDNKIGAYSIGGTAEREPLGAKA